MIIDGEHLTEDRTIKNGRDEADPERGDPMLSGSAPGQHGGALGLDGHHLNAGLPLLERLAGVR